MQLLQLQCWVSAQHPALLLMQHVQHMLLLVHVQPMVVHGEPVAQGHLLLSIKDF
jgi:hypothetical protein